MRKLIAYFIKYHVAVNVVVIAFFLLGIIGAYSLESSLFPLVDSKNINISIHSNLKRFVNKCILGIYEWSSKLFQMRLIGGGAVFYEQQTL